MSKALMTPIKTLSPSTTKSRRTFRVSIFSTRLAAGVSGLTQKIPAQVPASRLVGGATADHLGRCVGHPLPNASAIAVPYTPNHS